MLFRSGVAGISASVTTSVSSCCPSGDAVSVTSCACVSSTTTSAAICCGCGLSTVAQEEIIITTALTHKTTSTLCFNAETFILNITAYIMSVLLPRIFNTGITKRRLPAGWFRLGMTLLTGLGGNRKRYLTMTNTTLLTQQDR